MNANHDTGERTAAKSGRKRLAVGLAALLGLVLAFSIGVSGAFAGLKDTTSPVTVKFVPVKVNCVVNDNYSVKNDGAVSALVRATVVVNWIDRDGNIVANAGAIPAPTVGADWQQMNGFLYFNGVLKAGEATSPVIASFNAGEAPEGLSLQAVVLAEAIQFDPNGAAAQEAWNANYSDGKWSAAIVAG